MSGIAIEERLAVRELVDSYAAAADRGDHEMFGRLWTRDAVLRVNWPGRDDDVVISTPEAFASVIDRLRTYERTMHFVANQLCAPSEPGEVVADVYCEAHHLSVTPDRINDWVLHIRYADRYRRCGDGWRFVYRRVNVLWTENRAVRSAP
ncbi:nuclear transport factor 2 family protein [Streptomyces sp. NPDC002577]